jgi:ketosteroid isomerase-like protein
MSAEMQDLAVRYGAAWAGRDLDAIMAMHTDDTVFHLHGGGEPAVGRDATREAFAAALASGPISASTGRGCTSERDTS